MLHVYGEDGTQRRTPERSASSGVSQDGFGESGAGGGGGVRGWFGSSGGGGGVDSTPEVITYDKNPSLFQRLSRRLR